VSDELGFCGRVWQERHSAEEEPTENDRPDTDDENVEAEA
jgi:hypothetical protein